MDLFVINGGKKLNGRIKLQGSKNSALPILAAAAVTGKKSEIHNCPHLTDIDAAVKILRYLGCGVDISEDTVTVDPSDVCVSSVPCSLMREMRSSIVFLGPVLSRLGHAEFSFPGGCDIGLRPIDLHLSSLKKLGAVITESGEKIICTCPDGLKGDKITLSFPSVGATENIMIAAVSAKGTTTVINAAREPEIVDLASFLTKCGAKIYGAGEGTITIEGDTSFTSCSHTVIPDRIVASTFMAASAVTGGHIILDGVEAEHLNPVMPPFLMSGCEVKTVHNTMEIISNGKRPHSLGTIRTMPYPGFPTDSQALFMAVASVASGTGIFIENIFENRYRHVCGLLKMGAHITTQNSVAVVEGVPALRPAEVTAPDLRGGTALVLAALAAEGRSRVLDVGHIDRGCEKFETQLSALGADIKRLAI